MRKIIFFLFGALLIWGCSREYIVPGDTPNNRVVFTSEMDFNNRIQKNGTISFGDVSPGVVARKWNFPKNVDIVGTDNDSTSDQERIKAVFVQSGTYPVKLSQTFQGPAYVNGTLRGTTVDTTITVRVIDSVKVNFQANLVDKNGVPGLPLNLKNLAQNQITAGSTIRFMPITVGEPERLAWVLEGGTPPTSDATVPFDVKYKKVGIYTVQVIGNRARPAGADTLQFKELIKVVPSTEPVTLDGVSSVLGQGDKVSLNFSRDMDDQSLVAGNFTVSVLGKGKNVPTTVTGVALDAAQGNIVILTLSGKIYSDDVVTVSYTKGALVTSDGVLADTFSQRKLSFARKNLLESSSFDLGFEKSLDADFPYLGWGAPFDGYKLTVTNEQKHSGSKSAKIVMQPKGGMIIGARQNGVPARFRTEQGKTYEIGFWVRVASLGQNAPGTELPNVIFYWEPGTNYGVGRVDLDGTLPLNEWVYVRTGFVEFPASGDYQFWIRGLNANNSQSLTFYMDDISLSEVTLRP